MTSIKKTPNNYFYDIEKISKNPNTYFYDIEKNSILLILYKIFKYFKKIVQIFISYFLLLFSNNCIQCDSIKVLEIHVAILF